MALISELKELFKQIEINNSARKSDEDFIKYAFEKATAREEVIPLITDNLETKNEKTAAIKLQMAIKMSKDKTAPLEKIISYFNQSVAYAKHKSEILTKAYLDRQTFLMNMSMYEEALKDLEYVMATGITDKLQMELCLKKVKNLLALNKRDEAGVLLRDIENILSISKVEELKKTKLQIEAVKLSLEIGHFLRYSDPEIENKQKFSDLRPNLFRPAVYQRNNFKFIPIEDDVKKRSFNSPKIVLSYLYDLGYYLVAKEDIEAGELLLVDQIYEKVINSNERYLRCWNCTKFCWTCIPCHKCANVIFCSTQCRNLAFKNHHNIECEIISVLLKHRNFYNEKSFLSLRLFVRALKELNDLESLQRSVEQIKTGNYLFIYFFIYQNFRP